MAFHPAPNPHAHPVEKLEAIADFLAGLTVERDSFHTSTPEVLRSDIAAVKWRGGRVVGIGGVRRSRLLPVCYFVVASDFADRGIGSEIVGEILAQARGRYPFVLAVVLNDNPASQRICRKLGFRECLIRYKFRFLFVPLSRWGTLAFPFYYLLLPPCYLGFHALKNRLSRAAHSIGWPHRNREKRWGLEAADRDERD